MKATFNAGVKFLRDNCTSFDSAALDQQQKQIRAISRMEFPANANLLDYADVLLFHLAYPANKEIVSLVAKEASRLSSFLKSKTRVDGDFLSNTGLPFTSINSKFSHECLLWLQSDKNVSVTLTAGEESGLKLSEVLRYTLTSLERDYAAAGNEEQLLLEDLKLDERHKLSLVLDQLQTLNDKPLIKDYFLEQLELFVDVIPKTKEISRLYNRLSYSEYFFHDGIQKKFDHIALLNTPLPEPRVLSEKEKQQTIEVIRRSMLLAVRETDPATFMDEQSLRVYELERGVSVAIFGMTANRQLPLESYVGYTLFKNGYPASYGGGWVFGKRSLFGINVFEAFRGGESGLILCQLLRVYRQAFSVDYFEVEPYQYGADNPDGIKSGAFWFYYRFGFRPLDKILHALADKEAGKIKTTKNYRTSEKTLLKFTESNIALQLGNGIPPTVAQASHKITAMLSKKYRSNRAAGVKECIQQFKSVAEPMSELNSQQMQVLEEVALFAAAYEIKDANRISVLRSMVFSKPKDVFEYQKAWLQLQG